MGSFSWLRADHCTKRANLTNGDVYKILVPKEFGGGYIKDYYYDYGYINHSGKAIYVAPNGKRTEKLPRNCDLYGLLAYWNKSSLSVENKKKLNKLKNKHILTILRDGNTYSDDIRDAGLSIGCYDEQISKLCYPLKLVSLKCKDTYETCNEVSYEDPDKGFIPTYWG